MKEAAAKTLIRVLTHHPFNTLNSKVKLLALLKDYGGVEHPEIVILVEAFALQLPQKLLALSPHPLENEAILGISSYFAQQCFFAEDYCRWAVETWAVALGFTLPTSLPILQSQRGTKSLLNSTFQPEQTTTDLPISRTYPESCNLEFRGSIAIDHRHALMWMRCVVGQTWEQSVCHGEAMRYHWKELDPLVDHFNRSQENSGYHNWRVPSMTELQTLLIHPSGVFLQAFPTPFYRLWSSSLFVHNHQRAWYVDFQGGRTAHEHQSRYALAVRMVRSV